MENTRYLRKEKESQYEYGLRLIDIKMSESPEDLEWEDIIQELNLDVHRDTLRKACQTQYGGYAVAKYYQHLIEKGVKEDKVLKELESKKIELEKEKTKIKDQRRRLNELIRGQARFEQIKEDVIDCAKNLEPKLLGDVIGFNDVTNKQEAILCVSDVHYGMETDNYLNKYNTDIARERFKILLNKTINLCRVNYNVDTLHVLIQGDLVSGMIHLQNRLNAKESVIQQIMEVSELIAEFIDELAVSMPKVKVYHTVGNHARLFENKSDSDISNRENFEYITKWFLKGRLPKCKNVELIDNTVDESLITFNVFNDLIVASHGDKDRPNTVQERLRVLFDKKPSHIILAHYHSSYEKDFNGTTVVVNGSFCGVDDYTFEKRLFSEPYQKLLVFDKDEGEIAICKIKLNN